MVVVALIEAEGGTTSGSSSVSSPSTNENSARKKITREEIRRELETIIEELFAVRQKIQRIINLLVLEEIETRTKKVRK